MCLTMNSTDIVTELKCIHMLDSEFVHLKPQGI